MSSLKQIVKDVTLEETFMTITKLVDWSVEDDKLKVKCTQAVELEDYYYMINDREVCFPAVEFVVDCTVLYHIDPEDIVPDGESVISPSHIEFDQIVDLQVDTDETFDEREFVKDLMEEVSDTSTHPSIFMEKPEAIVRFASQES